MKSLTKNFGPLFGGVLFSIGLGLSGMTEPANIIAFLNVFGQWDPSLMLVMVGAIGIHAVLHPFVVKRGVPLFGDRLHLPTKKDIDKNLVLGAILFGLGWGITGLCPGPGLVSLTSGQGYGIAFVVALIVGSFAAKKFTAKVGS